MGSPYARENRTKQLLKDLQSQYDKDAGGYNIPSTGARGSKAEFVKSSFTPDQGGYYADQSIIGGPTTKSNKTGIRFYNEQDATDISKLAGEQNTQRKAEASLASARIPFKRVNPTLRASRKSNRKQRSLAYGRSGTILTGTLGGGQDKDRTKKKTLLG